MEGEGKKFEAPSGNSASTEIWEMTVEERAEKIATLQEQIVALRDQLNEYVGQNLTGALLEEADAIAKSLMEAETELAMHNAALDRARWVLPAKSAEGVYLVPPEEVQQLSPAANDGLAADDLLPKLVAKAA